MLRVDDGRGLEDKIWIRKTESYDFKLYMCISSIRSEANCHIHSLKRGMASSAAVTSCSGRCSGRSSELWRGSLFAGESLLERNSQVVHMPRQKGRKAMGVRAMGDTVSKGMRKEDGGRWLSSTTRHIRIYAAYIDPDTGKMDQTQTDRLSLILDPDDEFVWTEESAQKVFREFESLADNYAGADLTEYTLRLIGSDLEHFIRKMLLANEIQYNLNCRVLNFSMGKPRLRIDDEEDV